MSISKFNAEGYYDPTPYEALLRIEREAESALQTDGIYLQPICWRYRNVISVKAQGYCRFAVSRIAYPIAPHLLFPEFMDDDDEQMRILLVLWHGIDVKCSEVWVFGRKITKWDVH
ncbi:MAG: hypothetical protein ACFWTJ_15110 [Lachnoclostridium sp.]